MYRHLLQQEAWGEFQRALGEETVRLRGEKFEALVIVKRTKMGPYLYVPYGPALDGGADGKAQPDALQEAVRALRKLGESRGAVFVRIEPAAALEASQIAKSGFLKTKDLNPAETWVLDLRQTREEILHGMEQGTRTRHNQFSKKGLSVEVTREPEKIRELVRLQQKLAKEKGIGTFSEKYLKTELEQEFATLYLVKYENKIIAASLFFDDTENKTRYYMQSATDAEYKKLPATVGLLTAAIFDAKEKGMETFDFWGVAPEGAGEDHPWMGFTKFKRSFGGGERKYAGTWDLPLKPGKYRLYRGLRKVNRGLRKIKR